MRISSMPKCRCKTIEKISPHQPPSYQSLAKISSIVSPSGKSFFENLIIKKRAAMGPNISRRTKRKTPLLVYLPPPLCQKYLSGKVLFFQCSLLKCLFSPSKFYMVWISDFRIIKLHTCNFFILWVC